MRPPGRGKDQRPQALNASINAGMKNRKKARNGARATPMNGPIRISSAISLSLPRRRRRRQACSAGGRRPAAPGRTSPAGLSNAARSARRPTSPRGSNFPRGPGEPPANVRGIRNAERRRRAQDATTAPGPPLHWRAGSRPEDQPVRSTQAARAGRRRARPLHWRAKPAVPRKAARAGNCRGIAAGRRMRGRPPSPRVRSAACHNHGMAPSVMVETLPVKLDMTLSTVSLPCAIKISPE